MRTPLWFVDFDWTRFDPEKDKLCLLEEQDRKRLFKKKKKKHCTSSSGVWQRAESCYTEQGK